MATKERIAGSSTEIKEFLFESQSEIKLELVQGSWQSEKDDIGSW